MICKACGTECRGSCCPHCGEPLVYEAFDISSAPVQTVQQVPVTPAPASSTVANDTVTGSDVAPQKPTTSSVASGEAASDTAKPKRKKQKTRKPRTTVQIKMRQVFFPSLVFFLPLIYLFVDAFVLYAGELHATAEGGSVLSLLITRLSDAAFSSNPVAEVTAATLGNQVPLIEALTVWNVLAAPEIYQPLIAPAVILVVSALLSALCGVLILFTAGKLLRYPTVADLAVGGGFFAALAPLLADLAFRIYYVANGGFSAADAAMDSFTLSIELIFACGLSLTMMLPAVRAIRRAAGGKGIYLTAPYRVLGSRFGVIRTLGVLSALAAVLLPLASLFIEISDQGTMLEVYFDALEKAPDHLNALKAIFADNYALTAANALYGLLTLPIVPLMLLCSLPALWAVFRLLLANPAKVAAKRRRRKALKKTGGTLRRAAIAMLAFYIVFQTVAFLLLLFGTKLHAHIDLIEINGTLTLLYLLLAYVKTYGTLHTIGILFAALSLFFGTVAGNFSKAFVALAKEEYPS